MELAVYLNLFNNDAIYVCAAQRLLCFIPTVLSVMDTETGNDNIGVSVCEKAVSSWHDSGLNVLGQELVYEKMENYVNIVIDAHANHWPRNKYIIYMQQEHEIPDQKYCVAQTLLSLQKAT